MSSKKSLYRQNFAKKAREIGARHRELRRKWHIPQEKLSKQFTIGRSTISACESGSQEFPLSYLVSFCKEYNVNFDWLIDGVGAATVADEVAGQIVVKDVDGAENYERSAKLKQIISYLSKQPKLLEQIWYIVQGHKSQEELRRYQEGEKPGGR